MKVHSHLGHKKKNRTRGPQSCPCAEITPHLSLYPLLQIGVDHVSFTYPLSQVTMLHA